MKVAIVYSISEEDLASSVIPAKGPNKPDFEVYYEIEENYSPADSYEAMAKALRKQGVECYTLNIFDSYETFLSDYHKEHPDVVFNLVEMYRSIPSLEMSFACFLELMKVPYTGAPPLALGTCQKKMLAKRIMRSVGLSTPNFTILSSAEQSETVGLKYPLIVKPSQEDASIGIENESVVHNSEQLQARVKHVIDKFCQDALVEEYIDGREFNLSVIGGRNPRALPISEVDFSRLPEDYYKIVSYQAKWDPFNPAYHGTVPVCPADLDPEIAREAKAAAVKAFEVLGCRDYTRVDMRLSKDNKLYILEVNPNPDLTEDAGFMRSSKAAGMSFGRTLLKIVNMAYERKAE